MLVPVPASVCTRTCTVYLHLRLSVPATCLSPDLYLCPVYSASYSTVPIWDRAVTGEADHSSGPRDLDGPPHKPQPPVRLYVPHSTSRTPKCLARRHSASATLVRPKAHTRLDRRNLHDAHTSRRRIVPARPPATTSHGDPTCPMQHKVSAPAGLISRVFSQRPPAEGEQTKRTTYGLGASRPSVPYMGSGRPTPSPAPSPTQSIQLQGQV